MRVYRESLSVCVCASFPLGFKVGIWDLILLVPDNCLSVFFLYGNTHSYVHCFVSEVVDSTSRGLLWSALVWSALLRRL